MTWSPENRSQLIRIPAARGDAVRFELRSPDPGANPYIAYALLIYAGLEGIRTESSLCPPVNVNLFTAGPEVTDPLEALPASLPEALELARRSPLVARYMPEIL